MAPRATLRCKGSWAGVIERRFTAFCSTKLYAVKFPKHPKSVRVWNPGIPGWSAR